MTKQSCRARAPAAARPVILFLTILLLIMTGIEAGSEDGGVNEEIIRDEYGGSAVILDDPALFVSDATYPDSGGADQSDTPQIQPWPEITSVGRQNKTVHGVRSTNALLPYTVPDRYMAADPQFAALMTEAVKHIGCPYVKGMANPKDGFDCSGFVSWVFIHSGVYNTGRRGANGLYSLCVEVPPAEARPGDLVFFEGTMGPDTDGITHVGIYVGDHMMLHAGDPVGFADLNESKWKAAFKCFGRLPYKRSA